MDIERIFLNGGETMKRTAARHWLFITAITGFGLTAPAAHAESPTLDKIRPGAIF
ncbi:hypothetical protein [Caballeronia udeis]|uniref:hypothetical protein n=1 Tax=Caballeronia udeis TaxID=1232866 RepID=UPI000AB3E057|nr:hypothetical protein [Caballeronia udeis]